MVHPLSNIAGISKAILAIHKDLPMKNQITANFQTADLKHMRRALSARADALLARLSKDPAIRDFSKREAARCRKMAEMIASVLQGIG